MSGQDNFLLDTNVILGFLTGEPKIYPFFQHRLASQSFYVSQISRMELLGYPNLTLPEEASIKSFLSFTKIIPLSDSICDQAILVRRSTRLKLPDALIAASAICFNLILVTCDKDLLGKVEKLQSLNPITT